VKLRHINRSGSVFWDTVYISSSFQSKLTRLKQNTVAWTRSSAAAERPRDVSCHWMFC